MNKRKGKTVLLTGGSNGLGVETAKAFAKMEATVIITDIDISQQLSYIKNLDNSYKQTFKKLKLYLEHQLELLQGYEKEPTKLRENCMEINSWISDLEMLIAEFI